MLNRPAFNELAYGYFNAHFRDQPADLCKMILVHNAVNTTVGFSDILKKVIALGFSQQEFINVISEKLLRKINVADVKKKFPLDQKQETAAGTASLLGLTAVNFNNPVLSAVDQALLSAVETPTISTEAIEKIIKAGANPNLKIGTTPLITHAADRGNLVAVNALIKANADVNVTRSNGENALIIAIKNYALRSEREKFFHIIESLLAADCNVNVRTVLASSFPGHPFSPWDFALCSENFTSGGLALAELLMQYGVPNTVGDKATPYTKRTDVLTAIALKDKVLRDPSLISHAENERVVEHVKKTHSTLVGSLRVKENKPDDAKDIQRFPVCVHAGATDANAIDLEQDLKLPNGESAFVFARKALGADGYLMGDALVIPKRALSHTAIVALPGVVTESKSDQKSNKALASAFFIPEVVNNTGSQQVYVVMSWATTAQTMNEVHFDRLVLKNGESMGVIGRHTQNLLRKDHKFQPFEAIEEPNATAANNEAALQKKGAHVLIFHLNVKKRVVPAYSLSMLSHPQPQQRMQLSSGPSSAGALSAYANVGLGGVAVDHSSSITVEGEKSVAKVEYYHLGALVVNTASFRDQENYDHKKVAEQVEILMRGRAEAAYQSKPHKKYYCYADFIAELKKTVGPARTDRTDKFAVAQFLFGFNADVLSITQSNDNLLVQVDGFGRYQLSSMNALPVIKLAAIDRAYPGLVVRGSNQHVFYLDISLLIEQVFPAMASYYRFFNAVNAIIQKATDSEKHSANVANAGNMLEESDFFELTLLRLFGVTDPLLDAEFKVTPCAETLDVHLGILPATVTNLVTEINKQFAGSAHLAATNVRLSTKPAHPLQWIQLDLKMLNSPEFLKRFEEMFGKLFYGEQNTDQAFFEKNLMQTQVLALRIEACIEMLGAFAIKYRATGSEVTSLITAIQELCSGISYGASKVGVRTDLKSAKVACKKIQDLSRELVAPTMTLFASNPTQKALAAKLEAELKKGVDEEMKPVDTALQAIVSRYPLALKHYMTHQSAKGDVKATAVSMNDNDNTAASGTLAVKRPRP